MNNKLFQIIDCDKSIIVKLLFFRFKFDKSKYYCKSSSTKNFIDIKGYIQKYKYVLEEDIETETVSGYENYIWQCWLQGADNAPPIIKAAMNTVKKYNPEQKVVIITENNLKDYIELPEHIVEKYQKGIISRTHLSDYIRISLLSKYGGTWADASCYFTNKIPEAILKSDFFLFKNNSWYAFNEVPSNDMQKVMKRFQANLSFNGVGSSWFLHAHRGNILSCMVKRLLEEYWLNENCLIDYFLFHYLLTFAVLNNKDCKNTFNKMPSYNNIYPHLMQNVFYDKFDKTLYEDISKNSFVHKLKWKNIPYPNDDNFLNYLLNEK